MLALESQAVYGLFLMTPECEGFRPRSEMRDTKDVDYIHIRRGAIETITCVWALSDQVIPPIINYESADSECDLDYVSNQSREADLRVTLSNSLGFGGHNDCLVVGDFQA
jgi:hypothetical protein